MTPPSNPPPAGTDVTAAELARRTRRSFLKWAVGLATGAGGVAWIRTRENEDGIPWPLRRVHRANEWVGRQLFSGGRRVREFPKEFAAAPRTNGTFGWPDDPVGTVTVDVPGQPARMLSVAELIGGLPRIEETTELKCIEGWSQIVTWGGVRFADAMARLGIGPERFGFVGLVSPTDSQGRTYYVGLDSPSAFHPQTLLCDRMNGEPLPASHGGPLRLIIPIKYGIKNIKWLVRIAFADRRPADYWAERGYDWYAGL